MPPSYLDILKPLLRFDHWLFQKINQVWTNPFLDLVLPFMRQQEFWYFFYLFLLFLVCINFGIKGCWWAVRSDHDGYYRRSLQQFIDKIADFRASALPGIRNWPIR